MLPTISSPQSVRVQAWKWAAPRRGRPDSGNPIRQAAHLGMTTVTRVFAKSPGKCDYLHDRLHYGVLESTLTEVALEQAREKAPRRLQLTASTPGADEIACPGPSSSRPNAWPSHISVAPPVASSPGGPAQ